MRPMSDRERAVPVTKTVVEYESKDQPPQNLITLTSNKKLYYDKNCVKCSGTGKVGAVYCECVQVED